MPRSKRKSHRPTFVDVFAGCGGLSLGLKRAGWKGIFAVEKDPFAFETLSSNLIANPRYGYDWPNEIEKRPWSIGDLLDQKPEELRSLQGGVDLLAGGPPCQGFSHAGRRNPDDPRNRLFEDYLRLVAVLRPRFVLIENVRGFKVDFKNRKKGQIQNFAKTLEERLSEDYEISSDIIRACEFGVPQSRPRFFLIGARRDVALNGEVEHFFSLLISRRTEFLRARGLPKTPTASEAISDLEVARNGTKPSLECAGFEDVAYRAPRSAFQRHMRDGLQGVPGDMRLARHRPDIKRRFLEIIRASHEDGRLAVNISSEVGERYGLKKMALRVLDPLRHAPTVTSLPDDLLHYSEPRTLTVRENARLQTFPDWFAFKGKYTSGGHLRRTEVPRFTQVANAVPPLLAEQLGLALLEMLTPCQQPVR